MPNQINSTNTPKKYDAVDMHDLASLAESDMQWMSVAIAHVKKEIRSLHNLAKNGEILSQYHFSELITHLDMYEYLAGARHDYHHKEAEAYQAEWEKMKGGSHNA
ncbi:hypothetical protein [Acinetobacter seifertii]|uniref:hypothetical protein n=1 Tax=Acinetobacter seifertii TaxID=1530123 RepID=UPI0032B4AE87